MEAKLEMSMVPLQAEMMARSATMQARMMTRTLDAAGWDGVGGRPAGEG